MIERCANNLNSSPKESVRGKTAGPNQGLIVLLNASTADYYYTLKNSVGFNVHVFRSANYPDSTLGNFHDEVVDPFEEVFLTLEVSTLRSTKTIEQFTINERKCIFEFEYDDEYHGEYSYTDCLLKCRIRSISALCSCIPYFMPTNFRDILDEKLEECNLLNLACLEKYKTKWISFRPDGAEDVAGLQKEFENSLECPGCLPLCSRSKYNVRQSVKPITVDMMLKRSEWNIV